LLQHSAWSYTKLSPESSDLRKNKFESLELVVCAIISNLFIGGQDRRPPFTATSSQRIGITQTGRPPALLSDGTFPGQNAPERQHRGSTERWKKANAVSGRPRRTKGRAESRYTIQPSFINGAKFCVPETCAAAAARLSFPDSVVAHLCTEAFGPETRKSREWRTAPRNDRSWDVLPLTDASKGDRNVCSVDILGARVCRMRASSVRIVLVR
jgi:hypothetical protein